MNAVRIRKYKISNSGHRGAIVTVPKIQMADMEVEPGDYLSVYAGNIGGRRVLILSPGDDPVLNDDTSADGKALRGFIEAHQ